MKKKLIVATFLAILLAPASFAGTMERPVPRPADLTFGKCYALLEDQIQCFDALGTPLPLGVIMEELRPVHRATK